MNMLNVVVDTNIIIGAYFRNEDDCIAMLNNERHNKFNTIASDTMTEELLSVISYVYMLNKHVNMEKEDIVDIFKKIFRLYRRALPIEPQNRLNLITKDINDNKFLECAVEGNVDCIVTKNYYHFDEVKGKLKNNNGVIVNIYNPMKFNEILEAEQEVASGLEKNKNNKEKNKENDDIRE